MIRVKRQETICVVGVGVGVVVVVVVVVVVDEFPQTSTNIEKRDKCKNFLLA